VIISCDVSHVQCDGHQLGLHVWLVHALLSLDHSILVIGLSLMLVQSCALYSWEF